MVNVFAVPIFFICFRECLETVIIVSVLLSFLKQTLSMEPDKTAYKKLRKQVWVGVLLGLFIVLAVGGGMIGAFYALQEDVFANTEDIWEGTFSIIASVIITAMGAVLLRVSKLQDKWRVKLAKAIEARDHGRLMSKGKLKHWAEKYAMFMLPFVTVLREGLEAVVFIGGVGIGSPATAFPIPVITGIGAGVFIGFLIYKGGNLASLQIFLIASTAFLYLVSAGLFSKGIWSIENYRWNQAVGGDASETGSGPGSYDIRQSVWHVNCCNAEINGGGGWGVFNALLGWENSATYGSVIGYNVYWIAVICYFILMRFREVHGRWPFMKAKRTTSDASSSDAVSETSEKRGHVEEITAKATGNDKTVAAVTEARGPMSPLEERSTFA